MRRITTLLLALLIGAAASARADEHAPRVLSPHNADTYSMRTFAQYGRWKDLEGDYRTFYESKIPEYQSHWHYNADVEVRLDQAAPTVYLRYVGDPGVNNVRTYAHCLRETPCTSSPVVITHGWNEDGDLRRKTVRLKQPGPYEVVTEGDPDDEFVEIAVPSGTR